MSGLGRQFLVAVCLWAATANAADDEAEEDDFFHYGVIEYELSCLPCHGIDGRGDGPAARNLETPPSDLTRIARTNGGIFPADRLALVIDGRALVAAHGHREMPVWGERYRRPVPDAEGEWDIEHEAQLRIDALVRYIEGLQE